jgi:hypothetical protein
MGSRYLYAGDACVLPLDWGLTLNNSSLAAAGTHGIPVIGTELPVGRDEALEHGQNIYLCRPEDPEMLAEAIQLTSENTEIRERLREGILRLSRDWHSWDAMTERLVMVLESSISYRKAHTYHRSKLYQSASRPVTDKTRERQDKPSHGSAEFGRNLISSPAGPLKTLGRCKCSARVHNCRRLQRGEVFDPLLGFLSASDSKGYRDYCGQ